MVSMIRYNLPALQLVCHLVTLGNITNSFSAVDQSPQDRQGTLPDGYVAHPEIGIAYKFYNRSVTPMEARSICAREGAQLAVLDFFKKVEYMRQYVPFNKYLIAGIHRVDGEWINMNTGLPVPYASIPWKSGEPSRSAVCLYLATDHQGLEDYGPNDHEYFACQLPIS